MQRPLVRNIAWTNRLVTTFFWRVLAACSGIRSNLVCEWRMLLFHAFSATIPARCQPVKTLAAIYRIYRKNEEFPSLAIFYCLLRASISLLSPRVTSYEKI